MARTAAEETAVAERARPAQVQASSPWRSGRQVAWALLAVVILGIAIVGGMQLLGGWPNLAPPATITPAATATRTLTATATTPAAGATMTNDKDGALYVYVPAGEFLMGSVDDSGRTDPNERPQHTVQLDAYWIGRTEVTNAQYARCVQAQECRAPSETRSSTRNDYYGSASYGAYPVIQVSWSDAQAYCTWAGGRLPTEAEWEKAARGANGLIYPWGDAAPTADRLNFNSGGGDTSGTGNYPAGASPYGAFDMAGNVREWVADWYDENYYARSPGENPTGPTLGDNRVLRGGSWNAGEQLVRTAYRDRSDPDLRLNDIGFRCVR